MDAFAVFTGVHLHLALLAAVAGLTLAPEPRQQIPAAAAVSKGARGREAGVCRLLTRRPRPFGGAGAAAQVIKVLARAPVLTGVRGAHVGPPAAVARRWPAVHSGEELLLRPGEVELRIVVERQQQAANLHWPQAAGEGGSGVRTPQEDVRPFLEEIQVSRTGCRNARGFLVSIESYGPPGGREGLALHADLHTVPLSVTDGSLALQGQPADVLVSPGLELHHQVRVPERDGEPLRIFPSVKQRGGGLPGADAEGDAAQPVLDPSVAPVVEKAAASAERHVGQT